MSGPRISSTCFHQRRFERLVVLHVFISFACFYIVGLQTCTVVVIWCAIVNSFSHQTANGKSVDGSKSPSAHQLLEAMGPSEVLDVGEGCCDTAGRSILASWL